MSGQLLPPPGSEPTVPEDATPEQCIRMWVDLMNTCEAFLMAGLRRETGPDGDVRNAFRQWYDEAMREHDDMVFRMAHELDRRTRKNGS